MHHETAGIPAIRGAREGQACRSTGATTKKSGVHTSKQIYRNAYGPATVDIAHRETKCPLHRRYLFEDHDRRFAQGLRDFNAQGLRDFNASQEESRGLAKPSTSELSRGQNKFLLVFSLFGGALRRIPIGDLDQSPSSDLTVMV